MSGHSEITAFLQTIPAAARLVLVDTPGTQTTIPELRGVWGAALHGLDPAAYQAVFSPPDGGPPPGYLLRPAAADAETAPAFVWVLFGTAIECEPILRRAWDVASGMGLGPQRRRFLVKEFRALDASGQATDSSRPWLLSEVPWPLPGPDNSQCRLRFPAPLRLLRKKQLILNPTLADIVVAAFRRVAAFLPPELQDDWRSLQTGLLESARLRNVRPWRGERLDLHRWSARQQEELELRGTAGCLDLLDGPGELQPLLAAASWLHLGKGTVFGLGELRIEALPLGEAKDA